GFAARADPDRAATACLPRPPARPGALQAPAAHPGLGLRRLRPKRRRGPRQRPAPQARSTRPAHPPHRPRPRLPARPAMKTGSLRARVILTTLALLAIVLVAVVTAVTLAYRAKLNGDLRDRLTNAAAAVERTGSAPAVKPLIPGLALEGIATRFVAAPGAGPTKTSSTIQTHRSLLTLDEVLPDRTRVVFSASRASIDHAVTNLL